VAFGNQVVELLVVPERNGRPALVVADRGVDQDGPALAADEPGLHRHVDHLIVGAQMVGHQQVAVVFQACWGMSGKNWSVGMIG
jgi:hypothetical protein